MSAYTRRKKRERQLQRVAKLSSAAFANMLSKCKVIQDMWTPKQFLEFIRLSRVLYPPDRTFWNHIQRVQPFTEEDVEERLKKIAKRAAGKLWEENLDSNMRMAVLSPKDMVKVLEMYRMDDREEYREDIVRLIGMSNEYFTIGKQGRAQKHIGKAIRLQDIEETVNEEVVTRVMDM
jgi:hypothetical protein